MSRHWQHLSERGYTLIELTVAAVPLALIALTLFVAFGFTVAFTRRGEQRAEAVQQARLALHVMAQELREASTYPGAIIVWSRDEGAEDDGVGFLAARTDGPGRPFATGSTGGPEWEQAVYYIFDRARGERRRVTAEPSALMSVPTGTGGHVLARQVRQFQATRQGDLVTITLVVASTPENPTATVSLETAVRPRN